MQAKMIEETLKKIIEIDNKAIKVESDSITNEKKEKKYMSLKKSLKKRYGICHYERSQKRSKREV